MNNHCTMPMIYQNSTQECCVASLAMILEYYGKSVPYSLICEKTITFDEKGTTYTTATHILRAAKDFDLDCHGFKRATEKLAKTELPCILHWKTNQFIVLEKVDKDWFWVCDPTMGRRKLSQEEMDAGFTGVLLTFHPTEQFLPD